MNTYTKNDLRSLEMHTLISQKIKKDSSLLEKVKQTIQHWESKNGEHHYLNLWKVHIQNGVDNVISILTSDSQSSQVLRSSSPFTNILTEQERMEIFKKYK